MRISQLKTLVWIASAFVFGGVVFAGMQFYEGFKIRRQAPDPVEWPEVEGYNAADFETGAGRIAEYEKIWKTWSDGEIPPPPKVDTPKPPKPDPEKEFRGQFKYLGGIVYYGTSGANMARSGSRAHVSFSGKEQVIGLGQMLGPWQLQEYRYDPEKRADVLVFRRNDTTFQGSVTFMEEPKAEGIEGVEEIEPGVENPFDPPVSPDNLTRSGYRLADGSFFIPSEETEWYETYGLEKLLPTLGLRPNELPDGTVAGVKVQSMPGQGVRAIKGDRGIRQGDVIRSINDVPMNSSADIVSYLKGDGKGLNQYVVVIEAAGKERTEVYNVERRARR